MSLDKYVSDNSGIDCEKIAYFGGDSVDKDKKNKKNKEETRMNATLAPKMFPELGLKNVDKIRKSAETLQVKNGVIQLDKHNSTHREWFDNDEDYDI